MADEVAIGLRLKLLSATFRGRRRQGFTEAAATSLRAKLSMRTIKELTVNFVGLSTRRDSTCYHLSGRRPPP